MNTSHNYYRTTFPEKTVPIMFLDNCYLLTRKKLHFKNTISIIFLKH